jgi:hypothetical protein
MGIMRAFSRLLDGGDRGVEAHAVLSIVALLALFGFTSWGLWLGQVFSAADYGQAVALILGGGGCLGAGQAILNRGSRPEPGANVRPDTPEGDS